MAACGGLSVTPRCTFYEKVCFQKGGSVPSSQTFVHGASTSDHHNPKTCSNLLFPAWLRYPVMWWRESFCRLSRTQMPFCGHGYPNMASFSSGKCIKRLDDLSITAWKIIHTFGGLKQLTCVISQLREDPQARRRDGGRSPLPGHVAVGRIPLLRFAGRWDSVLLCPRFPVDPGRVGLPHISTRVIKVFKARRHQNSPVLEK